MKLGAYAVHFAVWKKELFSPFESPEVSSCSFCFSPHPYRKPLNVDQAARAILGLTMIAGFMIGLQAVLLEAGGGLAYILLFPCCYFSLSLPD